MRRLLALLLLLSAFVLPLMTSCVPGGYEGKNPARPDSNQVTPDQVQGGNQQTNPPAGTGDEGGTSGQTGG
jgi:hypothetical protein